MLAASRGRMAHGLMLLGPAGVGKKSFALALAQSLLCHAPDPQAYACGQCRSCLAFAAGTHPDFFCVSREEEATQIKIDQVRELIDFVFLSRSFSAVKIGMVVDAELMNIPAANSLLKTLEEPPPGCHLLLTCQRPSAVPPTVRSRCQKLRFPMPEHDEALRWLSGQGGVEDAAQLLEIARGAPVLARSAEMDPQAERRISDALQTFSGGELTAAECAHQLEGLPLDTVLAVFARQIRAAAMQVLRGGAAVGWTRLGADALFAVYDQILAHRGRMGTTLNATLVLESLLQFCLSVPRPSRDAH